MSSSAAPNEFGTITVTAVALDREDIFITTSERARGKFQATIALRNDHTEETFFTDEPPNFGWEIVKFVGDFPIVDHGAQLLRWPIKKRLLFCAEGGLRIT